MPEGFTVHPRLLPQLQRRAEMVADGTIDWAIGELLAFGSLLLEGHPVRLAGQDTRRGTFGQRHSVLVDRDNGARVHAAEATCPTTRRTFYVYDSLLSRSSRRWASSTATRSARPDALVLWEAQFGDFANGAQTIIDEFISGEQEVGPAVGRHAAAAARLRGPGSRPLVGPHRALPRAVRRGQHDGRGAVDARPVLPPAAPPGAVGPRRPLIVFTPKSMLRLRAASSADGGVHQRHLAAGDPRPIQSIRPKVAGPAVLRQDLLRPAWPRDKRPASPTPRIVRVEQLYPLPVDEIACRRLGAPGGRRTCAGSRRSRRTRAPGRSSR